MTEQWMPALGFEGQYEVSDHGRVRSLPRTGIRSDGRRYCVVGCIRVAHPDSQGRLQVRLRGDGRTRTRRVHHLVLEAFIGPAPDGLVCCHNDGNHLNNNLSNLRWDTLTANQYDSVAHGTHFQARKTHCPRGHAFAGSNLRLRRTGQRVCRICDNERSRRVMAEIYRRKKEARKKPMGPATPSALPDPPRIPEQQGKAVSEAHAANTGHVSERESQ